MCNLIYFWLWSEFDLPFNPETQALIMLFLQCFLSFIFSEQQASKHDKADLKSVWKIPFKRAWKISWKIVAMCTYFGDSFNFPN